MSDEKSRHTDRSGPELFWRLRRARSEGDVETLQAALNDEIEAHLAAQYLAEIGAVSAVPALIPLLAAADPHQRAAGALALGDLNGLVACQRIMEIAQQDEVAWVRSCAIEAAGRLSCDGGPLFIRALGDADFRVRGAAAEVLIDVGRLDALPALRIASKRVPWLSRGVYRKAIRQIKRRAQ
jgi:HEAT repeat protein